MTAPLDQRISVDVQTAADLVGLSRSTVREAIRSGELVAHYIGTKPLLVVDQLRAWIESAPTEKK